MTRTNTRQPLNDQRQELEMLALNLGLTALAKNLEEILGRAEQKAPSYTDFALNLFRQEMQARNERRLERGLKRAHLGTVEDLDGFDFSERPKLEPRIIKELCTCRFIEEKRNVLCLGKPGLGKTRIAKTIALSACIAGYSVLFVNTAIMLEQLQASMIDGTYHRTMRQFTKPRLIVADEFAYEPFDADAMKFLFRLVSARHRIGSIILTANTGFNHWKNLFPSESTAVATVDRLVDSATILRFTGKSHRSPRDIHGAPMETD